MLKGIIFLNINALIAAVMVIGKVVKFLWKLTIWTEKILIIVLKIFVIFVLIAMLLLTLIEERIKP